MYLCIHFYIDGQIAIFLSMNVSSHLRNVHVLKTQASEVCSICLNRWLLSKKMITLNYENISSAVSLIACQGTKYSFMGASTKITIKSDEKGIINKDLLRQYDLIRFKKNSVGYSDLLTNTITDIEVISPHNKKLIIRTRIPNLTVKADVIIFCSDEIKKLCHDPFIICPDLSIYFIDEIVLTTQSCDDDTAYHEPCNCSIPENIVITAPATSNKQHKRALTMFS
jgi:hypothetical protein